MAGGLFDRLNQEMEAREKAAGLSMADVLTLPDVQRKLFNWMMRQEDVGLGDLAIYSGQDAATAGMEVAALVEQGFVREVRVRGEVRYRVRLAAKRGRQVPLNIWQALGDKVEE